MDTPQITSIVRPAAAVQALLDQIRSDLVNDRLRLLSLPDIAASVGRALSMGSLPPDLACQYLMRDPVLAAKLMRRANNNRLSTQSPASTCQEAAKQLGTEAVFRLVAQSALREVLRPRHGMLTLAMRDYRQRALKVSSVSYVLACLHGGLDPAFGAQAGLLYSIGEAAILSYAQDYPALQNNPCELQLCRSAYGPDLGRCLLTRWGINPQLVLVAADAPNWERQAEGPVDYLDLVQVALWLTLLHEKPDSAPCEQTQIAAIARLGMTQRIEQLRGNIIAMAERNSACANQALNVVGDPTC